MSKEDQQTQSSSRLRSFLIGFSRIFDIAGSFYTPHSIRCEPGPDAEGTPDERAASEIHSAWQSVGDAMRQSMSDIDAERYDPTDADQQQRTRRI